MVGTTLIVDFGDVSEYTNTRGSTYRKGSISLFVEAMSWRIDRAGAWVTGSDDEEPSRADGVAALVGETVTRVSVLGDTLDVAVRFTSGLVLRSSYHESFSAIGPSETWGVSEGTPFVERSGT